MSSKSDSARQRSRSTTPPPSSTKRSPVLLVTVAALGIGVDYFLAPVQPERSQTARAASNLPGSWAAAPDMSRRAAPSPAR